MAVGRSAEEMSVEPWRQVRKPVIVAYRLSFRSEKNIRLVNLCRVLAAVVFMQFAYKGSS